jgi:mannose-1-phosphate guanylyltransferase
MTTIEAPELERFSADCALHGPRPKHKARRVVVADEAVIIAGGKGVRLRPYTTLLPKPLVPIGDKYSVLELILRQLAASGFTKVTLAIGHLGRIVDAYVGDGSQFGLEVRCLSEESPVGTLGPVLQMLDSLPENFLVMNADLLTNLDYRGLLDGHIAADAPLTVAACRREYHVDFGVLDIADRQIQQLREKPSLSYAVNMGIYGVRRAALADYEPGRAIGFDTLMTDLIAKGTPPNAYEFEGYWADIGRPEDYDKANEEFALHEHLLVPGR